MKIKVVGINFEDKTQKNSLAAAIQSLSKNPNSSRGKRGIAGANVLGVKDLVINIECKVVGDEFPSQDPDLPERVEKSLNKAFLSKEEVNVNLEKNQLLEIIQKQRDKIKELEQELKDRKPISGWME
jgi:hypothetical protein